MTILGVGLFSLGTFGILAGFAYAGPTIFGWGAAIVSTLVALVGAALVIMDQPTTLRKKRW